MLIGLASLSQLLCTPHCEFVLILHQGMPLASHTEEKQAATEHFECSDTCDIGLFVPCLVCVDRSWAVMVTGRLSSCLRWWL